MKNIIKLTTLVIGLSSVLLADVPYTFSDGQTARASEVNENFKALEDRIAALEAASGINSVTTGTTTISNNLQKLDGNLQITSDSNWPITKIIDANLLVERKTSLFTKSLGYTHDEAVAYCSNLVVGSTSDWRLPTSGELKALSAFNIPAYENYFEFDDANGYASYWSSTPGDKYYYSVAIGGRINGDDFSDNSNDEPYHVLCVKNY